MPTLQTDSGVLIGRGLFSHTHDGGHYFGKKVFGKFARFWKNVISLAGWVGIYKYSFFALYGF
jgi:hypothetical protein